MQQITSSVILTLWLAVCLVGCGGEEVKEQGNGNSPMSSASSSSSSSGIATRKHANIRVQAQDYTDFGGEDNTRNGATAGPCAQGQVDLGNTQDNNGICYLGWTQPGEYVEYEVSAEFSATFNLLLRISSNDPAKTATIAINGQDIGTVTGPNAGWDTYRNLVIEGIFLMPGKNILRVTFDTGMINLNYFELEDAGGNLGNNTSSSSSGSPVLERPAMVTLVPGTVLAEAYATSQGEDQNRQGAQNGRCGGGLVDLIDEGALGCAVSYTRQNEAVSYIVKTSEAGRYDFTLFLRSDEDSKIVNLVVDGQRKSQLGFDKSISGAFQDITVYGVKLAAGNATVTVAFETSNIDFLKMEVKKTALNAGTSTDNNLVGNISRGKDIWDAQCEVCHNPSSDTAALADAQLVVNNPTLQELTAYVHVTMPLGKPSDCSEQCAADVAAYIAESNPFFNMPTDDLIRSDRLLGPGGWPVPQHAIDPRPTVVARLSARQIEYSLSHLLGQQITLDSDFPIDARIELFDNNAAALFASKNHVTALSAELDDVLAKVFDVANPAIVPCDMSRGAACAGEMAAVFGKKAWRRPLSETEVRDMSARFDVLKSVTNSNRSAMRSLVKSILMSPNFIYRFEIDGNPDSRDSRWLNDFELATRLSYFIWSSTPDDALLELASLGKLQDEAVLRGEVARMLSDPKADSLIRDFVAQWLDVPAIGLLERSVDVYPTYGEHTKAAMIEEVDRFLADLINNNMPIRTLLTGNFTFLDRNLAELYQVPGDFSETFKRHDWGSDLRRRGLLGKGAILTTSAGANDEPAPVVRGMYVLERLLCKKPRQASGEIMDLFPVLSEDLFGRAKVELHRTNPVCASCHALMDPIGFGLQNFDSIGQWRTRAFGEDLDTTGTIPGGMDFSGPIELNAQVAQTPELPFCFSNHLATYALGRVVEAAIWQNGEEPHDYPFIYQVYTQTRGDGHKIQDIIEAIVVSDAFRKRRGINTLAEE